MRIEIGTMYATRGGATVKATGYDDGPLQCFKCSDGRLRWMDGRIYSDRTSLDDLVAEALPPTLDDTLRGLGATLPADDVHATLHERRNTHGDFAQVARYAQALKRMARREPGWGRLTDVQREAIDLDATKTARLMCGDPNHADTWLDKAGYARLGGGWKP